jgi:hypothetical protein
VDYFYSAAEHRSRGALWPSFAPARIPLKQKLNLFRIAAILPVPEPFPISRNHIVYDDIDLFWPQRAGVAHLFIFISDILSDLVRT